MLFAKSSRSHKRDPWINIAKLLNVTVEQAKRSKQDKSGCFAVLVDRVVICNRQRNSMITALSSVGF